jgi:surfeit locus 1 family protein
MTENSGRHNRPVSHEGAQASRSRTRLLVLLVSLAVFFAGFVALGTWQIQRLSWKEDLIARVDLRVKAAPVDAPGVAQWSSVNAESHEYRHVRISGIFLHELSTKVQATTQLGSGYWLMTPMRISDDSIVLINRGFIPQQAPDGMRLSAPAGVSTVTGLLRMSEPRGGYLRENDPVQDRWYSRDVQAIAQARGLRQVAPYFIDADAIQESVYDHASDQRSRYPVGGLTVVSFPNSHLVYALTWYALALMIAAAGIWIVRKEY